MARTARVVLPEHPHHVIQRGQNRASVFIDPANFMFYLDTLEEWKNALGCKAYAFCLMTNHVHLVIALCPDTRPNRNLGRTAQLGRCWIAARYSRGQRPSATPGIGVELGGNSFDRVFGHNGRTRLPDGQPALRKRPGPGGIARESSVEFREGGRYTSARRPPGQGRSPGTRVDPGE